MKFAMITPSYGPDFERCRLLCESAERYLAAHVDHYLIVDARDEQMFRPLEGPRTKVLRVEDLVPWWVRRVPGARRWWFSLKTPPFRNWVLQQLVKLSVGRTIDADAYLFVDSDVFFIRPFDPAVDMMREGRLRLKRVEGAARLPAHMKWHRAAAEILGLPPTDYHGSSYIGNLITWRRDVLHQMYEHIERVHGKDWRRLICGRWHISEYILYGVFVEHVLGGHAGHYYADNVVCHISWDYKVEGPQDLPGFFADVRPEHVAVMVSSKQGVAAHHYADRMTAYAESYAETAKSGLVLAGV